KRAGLSAGVSRAPQPTLLSSSSACLISFSSSCTSGVPLMRAITRSASDSRLWAMSHRGLSGMRSRRPERVRSLENTGPSIQRSQEEQIDVKGPSNLDDDAVTGENGWNLVRTDELNDSRYGGEAQHEAPALWDVHKRRIDQIGHKLAAG